MHHLRLAAAAMALGGLLLVLAAAIGRLDATYALVGLFLLWAGIVKVMVVALWRHLGSGPGPLAADERPR